MLQHKPTNVNPRLSVANASALPNNGNLDSLVTERNLPYPSLPGDSEIRPPLAWRHGCTGDRPARAVQAQALDLVYPSALRQNTQL